jgi:hypothetical protein
LFPIGFLATAVAPLAIVYPQIAAGYGVIGLGAFALVVSLLVLFGFARGLAGGLPRQTTASPLGARAKVSS